MHIDICDILIVKWICSWRYSYPAKYYINCSFMAV